MSEVTPERHPEQNYLFVSYSHVDASVVMSDLNLLKRSGVSVWHDEGIPGGALWREEVARQIRGSTGLLCFLSKSSTRSEYCVQEISFAIDERKPLICVYVEPVTLTAGLRMSLAHRQGLIRYSTAETSYHEKLLQAARSIGMSSAEHDHDVRETRLLPDVLVIECGERRSIVPGDFGGRFAIGRGHDCQLTIDSDFISRHHGFVKVHRGAFQYRDQSRNGSLLKTRTGEQLVHGVEVTLPESGDLKIGDVTIHFTVMRSNSPVGKSG